MITVMRRFSKWLKNNDYIRLPDDYEIDDYSIMEDFCYSIEDEELSEELLYAIRGNGAFRMFKEKIYQYDFTSIA